LHGGNLGLESQPGSGSVSTLFCRAPKPLSRVTFKRAAEKSGTTSFARILVIEDDRAAAQLLQSHLTSAGYDVVLCDQPGRALEMAAELQPSAVTMDIIMGPVNGWDLLSVSKPIAHHGDSGCFGYHH